MGVQTVLEVTLIANPAIQTPAQVMLIDTFTAHFAFGHHINFVK